MRIRHVTTVVAVILVGFGVKVIFFSTPPAEADLLSVRIDVSQMHQNISDLPVEKIRDMTFVFSDAD
jgi:hypothetical protein